MELFFVIVYGLVFGSFFNVVIYRLPNNMSLANPPSHCTSCNTKLKAIDLVPVISWICLKGKCRYCGEKISIRYTLVELLTSIVWMLLYLRFGLTIDFIAAVILMSIMINAAFIDLEHQIIPDELVILGSIAGVILTVLNGATNYKMSIYCNSSWISPIIGAATSSLILFAIAIVGEKIYKTDDALGFGDVKIFIPIGLFLGWKMSLMALLISFVLGAIVGIMLIVFKGMDKKSGMPFGPSIAMSVMIVYLFGTKMLDWYTSFF